MAPGGEIDRVTPAKKAARRGDCVPALTLSHGAPLRKQRGWNSAMPIRVGLSKSPICFDIPEKSLHVSLFLSALYTRLVYSLLIHSTDIY